MFDIICSVSYVCVWYIDRPLRKPASSVIGIFSGGLFTTSTIKCRMKLRIHSQTSTVTPLKLWNGYVFHYTLYWACDFLFMSGLKSICFSKTSSKYILVMIYIYIYIYIYMPFKFSVSRIKHFPYHMARHPETSWRPHQMKTCYASLALCEGNSSVNGGFPSQRPVTRSVDIFFYLRLNKRLSKQSRRR